MNLQLDKDGHVTRVLNILWESMKNIKGVSIAGKGRRHRREKDIQDKEDKEVVGEMI